MFMWINIIIFISLCVVLVYLFIKRKYAYWADLGVPYAVPSFPYGNIGDVGKKLHTSELYEIFYKQFKNKTPVMGFYATIAPKAMIMDLDLIHRIFIKDFQYFHDRAQYYNLQDDPLSAHLFNLDGERWRNLRAKITPTFTSGKIKMMLPTVVDVADNFHKMLFREIAKEADVEIKDYLARFTTDVIGSCAFGLECNSLENPNAEFRQFGEKAFSTPWWKVIKFTFTSSFVTLARKLRIRSFDVDVADFYKSVVFDTVKYREKTGVQRKDFLNLLMEIRDKNAKDEDISCAEGKLTLYEIAAQSAVFFLAGYEISSTAMTFALYEMAKQPEIQEKARKNVKDTLAKYGGKFTYEAAMEMTYLDQVINETLRKFALPGSLTRRVTHDYQVPGTKIILKKGLRIIIPTRAIQNDPEIFPDPDKFDPERFSPENMKKLHNAAFLPFGDGPRNCIGSRFGMLQVRIGLVTILKSFIVSPTPRTPDPIVLGKDTFAITPKGGLRLNLKRIT